MQLRERKRLHEVNRVLAKHFPSEYNLPGSGSGSGSGSGGGASGGAGGLDEDPSKRSCATCSLIALLQTDEVCAQPTALAGGFAAIVFTLEFC